MQPACHNPFSLLCLILQVCLAPWAQRQTRTLSAWSDVKQEHDASLESADIVFKLVSWISTSTLETRFTSIGACAKSTVLLSNGPSWFPSSNFSCGGGVLAMVKATFLTHSKNLIPVAEASLWVSFSLHDYQGLLIVSRIPVYHSVLL